MKKTLFDFWYTNPTPSNALFKDFKAPPRRQHEKQPDQLLKAHDESSRCMLGDAMMDMPTVAHRQAEALGDAFGVLETPGLTVCRDHGLKA